MNNNGLPIYLNTWVIVLAFIFCWPVGVVLIFLRTNANKKNMFDGKTVSKICNIVGAFLILGGLGTFSSSFFAGLFYVAGGAALIYYGKQNQAKIERYKRYIDLIVNRNVVSLDMISSTTGVAYSTVRADIDNLIAKGTFKGATINELSRTIELREVPTGEVPQEDLLGGFVSAISGIANQMGMAGTQTVNNNINNVTNNPGATITAVTCPGCGVTRRAIKGVAVECEYCGSVFNA